MENSISNLIEIIEQESEILEILSDLLYRQKSAALAGDIELLNRITEAQSRAYAKIAEMETLRKELIIPLADELEMKPEEVTLDFLKDKIRGENGGKLNRLYNLVKPLSRKVKRAAKMNQIIINRCLEHGEQRLRMLLDFSRRQEIYRNSGKKEQVGGGSGSMVNKKL